MPKVIMEFNLPEEQDEFDLARQGSGLNSTLWEFDNYLRSRLKYEELSDEVHAALQAARNKLHEIKNEYGVIET